MCATETQNKLIIGFYGLISWTGFSYFESFDSIPPLHTHTHMRFYIRCVKMENFLPNTNRPWSVVVSLKQKKNTNSVAQLWFISNFRCFLTLSRVVFVEYVVGSNNHIIFTQIIGNSEGLRPISFFRFLFGLFLLSSLASSFFFSIQLNDKNILGSITMNSIFLN